MEPLYEVHHGLAYSRCPCMEIIVTNLFLGFSKTIPSKSILVPVSYNNSMIKDTQTKEHSFTQTESQKTIFDVSVFNLTLRLAKWTSIFCQNQCQVIRMTDFNIPHYIHVHVTQALISFYGSSLLAALCFLTFLLFSSLYLPNVSKCSIIYSVNKELNWIEWSITFSSVDWCNFAPSQVDFSAIPRLMLCSIIFMRSSLTFEGGHQISVNLFLKAGDSCNNNKRKNKFIVSGKWIYEKSYNVNCGERYENIIDHRRYTHNLSSCEIKAWKKLRPERDLNPWPLRYRCSALVTLWAHKYTWSFIYSFVFFIIYEYIT